MTGQPARTSSNLQRVGVIFVSFGGSVRQSVNSITRAFGSRRAELTKSELQQYYWTKKNIEKSEQRLEELYSMAESITARLKKDADAIQGRGNTSDKVGNITSEIYDVKQEIEAYLESSVILLRRIEASIKQLPAREMYLIRARYIENRTWEQICVDMNYGWRQIHRIHSDALNELAKDGTQWHTEKDYNGIGESEQ